MSPRPWPPTSALRTVVAVTLIGAVAALVLAAPAGWVALPLAVALGTSAVAVDRWTGGRDRARATDVRRLAPDEASRAREIVGRRPVLLRGTLGAVALIGVSAVGWLWRFGPRRPTGTGWADGVRLVDEDRRPLRPDDLPPGGIVTVWPDQHRREELAAVVLLRLPVPPGGDPADDGTILAYSRICTHAGCPVALFRVEDGTLYCPCHQATFDARHDARPVFGPASRPLPKLPLGTDPDGFLVARGDFSAPPGPLLGARP